MADPDSRRQKKLYEFYSNSVEKTLLDYRIIGAWLRVNMRLCITFDSPYATIAWLAFILKSRRIRVILGHCNPNLRVKAVWRQKSQVCQFEVSYLAGHMHGLSTYTVPDNAAENTVIQELLSGPIKLTLKFFSNCDKAIHREPCFLT